MPHMFRALKSFGPFRAGSVYHYDKTPITVLAAVRANLMERVLPGPVEAPKLANPARKRGPKKRQPVQGLSFADVFGEADGEGSAGSGGGS